MQQFSCNDSPAQRFALEAAAGGVQIRAFGSQTCVDVPNDAVSAGTQLQLFACNGTDAQIFATPSPQMRKLDSGVPGVCVDSSGAALTAGLRLQTWGCNGTSAQNWEIDDNLDGTRTVRRNSTGLCMEASGTPAAASPVTQDVCNRSPAQTWVWEPQGSGQQLRLDGTSFCLDVFANSNTAGTQLGLWQCNGTNAQIFGL